MSKTVDKRVVQMEFDNKQFENNIGQSMSSLNNLNKQLKDLEGVKGLEELSKATDKLNFKNAEESVDGLGKKFSALEEIAIGSLRRIGEMATDMGIKLAKSLSGKDLNNEKNLRKLIKDVAKLAGKEVSKEKEEKNS